MFFVANAKYASIFSLALLAPLSALADGGGRGTDAWVGEAPELLVLRLEQRLGVDSWLAAQTADASASPLLAPETAHSSAKSDVDLPRTYGFSKGAMLPLIGAAGDSISTHIGLQQANVLERNGLINTSPAGLVGLFVIKAGVIYAFDQQPQHVRKPALKMTAGLWNGVIANNLFVAAGASNPVSLLAGVAYGVYMYHREHDILEREEAAARGQTEPVW